MADIVQANGIALTPMEMQIQQQAIDRQRAIATALQQASMQAPEGQMVSGHYVAPSATQYLARLAQGLIGKNQQSDLDQKSRDMATMQGNVMRNQFGVGDQSAPQTSTPNVPAAVQEGLSQGAQAGSVGPTNDNLARVAQALQNAPQATTPQVGSRVIPGMNPVVAMQMALDPKTEGAYATAYLDQFKLPDAVKTNNYYGLDKSGIADAMARENAAKGQTLVREDSTLGRTDANGKFHPIFTAPGIKTGVNIDWSTGSPVATEIPGMAQIKQNMAAATTAGEGSVLPYAGRDAKGNPLPVTNRTAVATQGSNAPQGLDLSKLTPQQIAILQKSDPDAFLNGISNFVRGQNGSTPGAVYADAPLGVAAGSEAQTKGQVETMQNSYKGLQAVRSGGNMALEDIGKMLTLGSQKSILAAGPQLAGVAGIFSSNAAEYEKSRDNLVANLGSQLGMGTDAAREMVYGSIPAYGAPKEAIQHGLQTLQGQVQMRMLKADYLSQHYANGDPTKYNQAENQFDQKITPQLSGIIAMPPGPTRAKMLQAAAKDPQMRANLEWAVQNGILK
jgi:hypothetical protein